MKNIDFTDFFNVFLSGATIVLILILFVLGTVLSVLGILG